MSLGEAVKSDVKNYGSMSDTVEDIADEESEVGRIVWPIKTVEDKLEMEQFPANEIRTTKYTILTFLPKNLFEQFHRMANFFFLFIAALNFVPEINSFGKEVAMLPLLFVLSVTAIKDIFEDRRRYLSDRELNNSQCQVYNRYPCSL
jgi:phospholipid-translocating ATPase